MSRKLVLVPLLLAAAVAAMLVMTREPLMQGELDLPEPAPESRPLDPEVRAEPVTRPRPLLSLRMLPETRPGPRRAPHRGVRGIVTSPSVTLADGSHGVDPQAWEATVYALVPRPQRRTVDRIGILKRKAPSSPRGDFEIDLPTGSHLLLIQHRVEVPGSPPLLEAWYAYADVAESDSVPLDLGRHTFAAAAVRGIVLDEKGAACGGSRVDLSDEVQPPGDPLTRGVHLISWAGADGRFALSIARNDRTEVVGCVSARSEGAEAHREGVRLGEAVELILQTSGPEADVVFEVTWSPEMRLCIHSEDRRLAFMREGGRAPAGGVLDERRRLPPGKYVVEVFRRVSVACDEWAREQVEITHARPQRVRIEPVFSPARTVTGRARKGTTVAWVTRIADGSTFVRDSVTPDSDGQFAFRGVPTAEILLRAGSILTRVPPGSEPEIDIGDLASH